MQGRLAAGKKRGPVAAPQSLKPRAGASQSRDAGPHASGARGSQARVGVGQTGSRPWTTKDATRQREARDHVWAGLTRHVGGTAARSYDCGGRGADSGQYGQGPKPPGLLFFIVCSLFFSRPAFLLFIYINTCVTSARKCRCLRNPEESVASPGAGVKGVEIAGNPAPVRKSS